MTNRTYNWWLVIWIAAFVCFAIGTAPLWPRFLHGRRVPRVQVGTVIPQMDESRNVFGHEIRLPDGRIAFINAINGDATVVSAGRVDWYHTTSDEDGFLILGQWIAGEWTKD